MAKCMHKIVLINKQMTIQKTRFISMFVDDVTTMDYQSWLSVHVDG
jgi:hypothetical protein